jgi:hypothetical protein
LVPTESPSNRRRELRRRPARHLRLQHLRIPRPPLLPRHPILHLLPQPRRRTRWLRRLQRHLRRDPRRHRRILRRRLPPLQRRPRLRRSLQPRQLLHRLHPPYSRSRKARQLRRPCNRRSGSEAGKGRARHRSPPRAEPRQRQPLLLQARRRQARDHRPHQRSHRRPRLRREHLRRVAHNRTPLLREHLAQHLP